MLQPRPQESLPTVAVDRRYAELVTDLEIDAEEIAEYLRERGLSEEEIGQLTINYSVDAQKGSSFNEKGRTLGHYLLSEKTIQLYRPEVLFSYKAPLFQGSDEVLAIDSGVVTERKVNATLIHELEHYIDDITQELSHQTEAHQKATKKELLRSTIKNRAVVILGSAGLAAAYASWSGDIVKVIESTGGNVLLSNAAILTVAAGTYALVGHIGNKTLKRSLNGIQQEAYFKAPAELKARAAEVEYEKSFIKMDLKPQYIDDLKQAILESLTQVGEVDGITSKIQEPSAQ